MVQLPKEFIAPEIPQVDITPSEVDLVIKCCRREVESLVLVLTEQAFGPKSISLMLFLWIIKSLVRIS